MSKKIRTILTLDYDGVRLVQFQTDQRGLSVINSARRKWSDKTTDSSHVKREQPFTDMGNISRTVDDLLYAAGRKRVKIDLLLPDSIARVSLLELTPPLPDKREELLQTVYFKAHKGMPYRFEDTRIAVQALSDKRDMSKKLILAVFTSRELIEGLENTLSDLGMEPGRIGLSALNLYNIFERELGAEEDTVFVAVFKDFFSLFLFSHGLPVFFRSKALDGGGEGLFFELKTSLLYYLNQDAAFKPQRVLFWKVGETTDIAAWLEGLCDVKPIMLKSRFPLGIRQGLAITPEELMSLAPAIGMVTK